MTYNKNQPFNDLPNLAPVDFTQVDGVVGRRLNAKNKLVIKTGIQY